MFDFVSSFEYTDWSLTDIANILMAYSEPISGECESDVNSFYDFDNDEENNNESNIAI